MATHSSTLAWKIPWMEEPGRLQSMGSQSQTRLSDFSGSLVEGKWEADVSTTCLVIRTCHFISTSNVKNCIYSAFWHLPVSAAPRSYRGACLPLCLLGREYMCYVLIIWPDFSLLNTFMCLFMWCPWLYHFCILVGKIQILWSFVWVELLIWSTVESGFGEDNGTPLQYSCLENPMDGGAW